MHTTTMFAHDAAKHVTSEPNVPVFPPLDGEMVAPLVGVHGNALPFIHSLLFWLQ